MTKDFSRQRPSAYDYIRAKHFTDLLKKSEALTLTEQIDLYHRAIHGDLKGAREEYERIMYGGRARQ